MEWKTIETAPKKHATQILVCEPGRTMAVVFWLGKSQVMYDEERWDDETHIVGWYISDGKNDPIWYRNWPQITHWMPLPPPPKEQ